ncbi:MAG: LacI family DNA-binding transcriptional regulator [Oscillospiraceae bacterium]|nr:LacI family DNA-binding transcriptional regulator [Oscillospiraceae bacterium]
MTIKEIADLAGTSRGTVDRVLNGRGKVNPELEAKIRKIAASAHYQPNVLAQALINSRKTFHIGVVVHSVDNPFFIDVLKGINERAKKLENYGLKLSMRQIKGYDPVQQLQAVKELRAEGIDGLAIMPMDLAEIREALEELDIPVVTFNSDIDIDRLAFVGCNYYNSGMISGDVARLLLHGGGTAAVVVGSLSVRGHRERVQGFMDCIRDLSGIRVLTPVENQDDDQISYETVRKLLREHQPDLLYFAAAGLEGGLRAVRECGREVHIIAVDETELVRRCLADGTVAATVTQQPYLQGELPIRILYDFLANKRRPKQPLCFTSNEVKFRHNI